MNANERELHVKDEIDALNSEALGLYQVLGSGLRNATDTRG